MKSGFETMSKVLDFIALKISMVGQSAIVHVSESKEAFMVLYG